MQELFRSALSLVHPSEVSLLAGRCALRALPQAFSSLYATSVKNPRGRSREDLESGADAILVALIGACARDLKGLKGVAEKITVKAFDIRASYRTAGDSCSADFFSACADAARSVAGETLDISTFDASDSVFAAIDSTNVGSHGALNRAHAYLQAMEDLVTAVVARSVCAEMEGDIEGLAHWKLWSDVERLPAIRRPKKNEVSDEAMRFPLSIELLGWNDQGFGVRDIARACFLSRGAIHGAGLVRTFSPEALELFLWLSRVNQVLQLDELGQLRDFIEGNASKLKNAHMSLEDKAFEDQFAAIAAAAIAKLSRPRLFALASHLEALIKHSVI